MDIKALITKAKERWKALTAAAAVAIAALIEHLTGILGVLQ